jgi:Iron-sulfur cluster binding domain of dihydroorotate dehydrogenase B
VLACGPEPMLQAVARLAPSAQLAWEAPMACGYGACYGCAVEIRGALRRLCIEGPVLSAADAPVGALPEAGRPVENGRRPLPFPAARRARGPVSAADEGEAA